MNTRKTFVHCGAVIAAVLSTVVIEGCAIPPEDPLHIEASIEELGKELEARQAAALAEAIAALARAISVTAVTAKEEPGKFQKYTTARLIGVERVKEKAIYGVDNRLDLFRVTDADIKNDADSVVALFRKGDVHDNRDGTSTLLVTNYGVEYKLCPVEPFRSQPTGAFCSGFLVAPNVVATAGHCIYPGDTKRVRFVFGFRMIDEKTGQTKVANSEIYSGTELMGREYHPRGADWALVRLDRVVTNHRVSKIRRSGKIENGVSVHVIGHPSGLPTKYAGDAWVRENSENEFFTANLDTYGGNSGSPVFNSDSHEVEGILVRGEADYRLDDKYACWSSKHCPTTGCAGEDVTRITILPGLSRMVSEIGS